MTRTRPKTHLAYRQGTACGVAATHLTTLPHLVTCGRCLRSIHLADAEAKAAMERRRKDAP